MLALFRTFSSVRAPVRRVGALLTALIMLASVLGASPVAAQEPEPETETNTTPSVDAEEQPARPFNLPTEPFIIIDGGGWGHGVGMSQYGAYGRAAAGQNYEQILKAYYTGVQLEDTDLAGDIEVHLIETSTATFQPEGPIAIKGGATVIATAGNGDTVRIGRSGGAYSITVNGDSKCGGGGQTVCPPNQMGIESTGNARVPVRVSETGNRYQYGRFRLRVADNANNFNLTISSMTVDEYLYGLGEMPASWPMDALRAQVLAARTFAIGLIQARRGSTSWDHPWDIYSTVRDQAYVGMRYETAQSGERWVQAVNTTTDEVITHNGNLISANYSSSNGGASASNAYVWGSTQVPYLVSVPDAAFDNHKNPYGEWQRVITLRNLSRYFAAYSSSNVGEISGVSITGPFGASGRINDARVTLTGSGGTKTINGDQFRWRINEGLSADGKTALADQILSTNLTFKVEGGDPPIDNQHRPEGRFRFDEVNTTTNPPKVAIRGWALDQDKDEAILVRVMRNGTQIHAVTANSFRPTIGDRFNMSDNHGIDIDVELVAGLNEICLVALDLTDGAPPGDLGCRTISRGAPSGTANVAVSYVGAPQLAISGTATDPDHSGRTGIHVYIDGNYAGGTATTAGSGSWSLNRIAFAGGHRVCSYAIDNVAGAQASPLGCESITVSDRIDSPTGVVAPVGLLESVLQNGTSVTLNGWAFDPNSSSPVRLAINVDGNRFLNTTADDRRPGLGQRFDRDPRIGFSETLQLSPGRHQICIWAAKPGPNTLITCLYPNL